MAATAYAALVSLLNTVDQIQIHPHLSTCFDMRNESLREKACLLVGFVENHSDDIIDKKGDFLVDADSTDGEEDLLSRIAVIAQLAEDIIEVEAADWIRDLSTEISPSFLLDLEKIVQDMDSIIKEVVIFQSKEERRFQDEQPSLPRSSSSSAAATLPATTETSSMAPPSPSSSSAAAASPPASAKTKSSMVGFDGYMEQVLDELNGSHSNRRILPIVGMGGVGKTTLARNVYHNSLIVERFAVRVWVTVSQTFSVSDIFLQALSCLGESSRSTDDNELGEELRKTLYGRRYLIVLDDMWSIEAWEMIKFYFPDNNNGSRIVVTTRQHEVVDYFGSSAIALDLLDYENSWVLFCDMAFGEEGCPPELEEVGEKIVYKCKGLPLAITVMAGLLGNSPRTQEYWEKIAKENSGEGNEALSILYLSYKHLPVCLKPCFLYLGLFSEDHHIKVSQLIKLFVAEGFIKPQTNYSLEEVAEYYIIELVYRNLLLVSDLKLNKKLKTCFVHDLVRELCTRIAEKENFYRVQRSVDGTRHYIADEKMANFYPPRRPSSQSPSLYSPLVYFPSSRRPGLFKSRLLRVVAGGWIFTTRQEVNLRFHIYNDPSNLSISVREPELPPLSLLWSMQTLILRKAYWVVPPEIWNMPQLRHINSSLMFLPDPPAGDIIVLHNLQTLKKVKKLNLREEVCKRIPNIKELEIEYNSNMHGGPSWSFHLQNVGCLHKLEKLVYYYWGSEYVDDQLQNLKFPDSLKELTLGGTKLSWSDMGMISSLPRLQFLKLSRRAVLGAEWNFVEEVFLSLKHLQIHSNRDLVSWEADSFNFPVLETLHIEKLEKLVEIPSGIGDIPTLERIEVKDNGESVTMSAIRILEEQESLENLDLQLHLNFEYNHQAQEWLEKIQESEITCQNLYIFSRRSGFT